MKIRLNMISDIYTFVRTCSQFYEGKISIKQGWQTIDGSRSYDRNRRKSD